MGPYREHSHNVNLEFKTSDVMDEVFKTIDDGDVYYASEVIISHSHSPFHHHLFMNIGHCQRVIHSQQ